MKKIIFLAACMFIAATIVAQVADSALQKNDSSSKKTWQFEASALVYFVPSDIYALPILKADHKHLHLESRYNYEDFETVSVFGGYNFSGGKKLEYTITPMIGFVTGNSDGIAPGLELDLTLGKFNWYSEMEYLVAFSGKDDGYFYGWTELTFAPKDWVWFGISGQRIRPYQTDLDVQRGVTLGFAIKKFELSGYYFNPFSKENFGIVSLAYSF